MIKTSDLQYRESIEFLNPVQPDQNERDTDQEHKPAPGRKRWARQVIRFGLVGGLNTIVDLLILNMLLQLFPTDSSRMILIFSAIAYSPGAVNSFLLNKYWTFGYRQKTTLKEVVHFILTTLCGIGWSSIILWLASNALHPLLINPTIWANASKVVAICGTALINYLGMSLWVFVNKAHKEHMRFNVPALIEEDRGVLTPTRYGSTELLVNGQRSGTASGYEQSGTIENEPGGNHSISVVLPAYNEEEIIL